MQIFPRGILYMLIILFSGLSYLAYTDREKLRHLAHFWLLLDVSRHVRLCHYR
jgi:hypothetical protein